MNITDHCLTRKIGISDRVMGANQSAVDACLEKETFEETWPCIENDGPHSAGRTY